MDERDYKAMNKHENGNEVLADVIIRCPVCKSGNIADISTYQSNGIYGHGSRIWKTSDMRSCEDCGVIFKPVKGNGL